MNDKRAIDAETIRQGEALANGCQFSDDLSEYLALDAWDNPSDAMQILCGLYPSQGLGDGFQFFDSCVEQHYEKRCEVLRPGMLLRIVKETLEKMARRWSSGSHPQRPSPEYYLQWATQQGFDVPWIADACRLGLVDVVALGLTEDHENNTEAAERQATTEHRASTDGGRHAVWIDLVREIALEFIGKHEVRDLFPSQNDVCAYVADVSRERKIFGPHGKPLESGYIKREAIQGDWWQQNKSKGSQKYVGK